MVNEKKTLEEFTATYKETNPDATDEDIKAAYDASLLEGMNLTEKVVQVMDDYGKMLMTQMKATLEKQMAEVVKSTQDELVTAIRKGVGLDDDPVIHLSEVNSLVRKMLLEKEGGDGKKTGEGKDKGPGGNADDPAAPVIDVGKMWDEANKGRQF